MVTEYNDPRCRPRSMLNLAGFLPRSAVNGPGIRAVVWVRGCPFHCEGCFNAQFQSSSPVTLVPVDNLAVLICSLPGIHGVTFSGGEPFAQAGPLAALGERLRSSGLSVVTYTGYTPGQIADGDDPSWPALLAVTDLLIAGPYIARLSTPDPLKGSSNQEVISLGTGTSGLAAKPQPGEGGSRTEFSISPDGTITTTGFPASSLIGGLASRTGEG